MALVLMTGAAQSAETRDPAAITAAAGVPVHAGEPVDRPYEVIGTVEAEVRRAPFRANPSPEKIYRELWERARKLDADAVIHARYGAARVTVISYGSVRATGTAIRYK